MLFMSWDPFRELQAWQERLGRLATHQPESWSPAIDVYETDDSYIIAAEVPGLTREEIELAAEDTRLTIRGQRSDRRVSTREVIHFHQVERGHGAFARTFEFAERIDGDRVAADLSDGVLTIKLPKMAPPPARKIAVK
jgi:HSP20 family protein